MLRDEQESGQAKIVGPEGGLAGIADDAVLVTLIRANHSLKPARFIGTIDVLSR